MNLRLSAVTLGVLLPSCAATSGREWLQAPIEPRALTVDAGAPAPVAESELEARPRLRHTVTLGESYEAVRSVPASDGPAVQVNVTNHVPVVVYQPVPTYGYGYGYGPAYGYSRGHQGRVVVGAPVKAAPSTPQKVGGDWPAIPDYGPRWMR